MDHAFFYEVLPGVGECLAGEAAVLMRLAHPHADDLRSHAAVPDVQQAVEEGYL